MYYTYILQDLTSRKYYTGHTDNINRRLKEHQSHQSRYTARRGPFKLVYQEEYNTRAEAMKRERYLKTGKGREELARLLKD